MLNLNPVSCSAGTGNVCKNIVENENDKGLRLMRVAGGDWLQVRTWLQGQAFGLREETRGGFLSRPAVETTPPSSEVVVPDMVCTRDDFEELEQSGKEGEAEGGDDVVDLVDEKKISKKAKKQQKKREEWMAANQRKQDEKAERKREQKIKKRAAREEEARRRNSPEEDLQDEEARDEEDFLPDLDEDAALSDLEEDTAKNDDPFAFNILENNWQDPGTLKGSDDFSGVFSSKFGENLKRCMEMGNLAITDMASRVFGEAGGGLKVGYGVARFRRSRGRVKGMFKIFLQTSSFLYVRQV